MLVRDHATLFKRATQCQQDGICEEVLAINLGHGFIFNARITHWPKQCAIPAWHAVNIYQGCDTESYIRNLLGAEREEGGEHDA